MRKLIGHISRVHPAKSTNIYEDEPSDRMVAGYNLLRDALAWFESHSVEQKLGHLPQWVDMGRQLTKRI